MFKTTIARKRIVWAYGAYPFMVGDTLHFATKHNL